MNIINLTSTTNLSGCLPAYKLEEFQTKVSKLTKKAIKCNVSLPKVSFGETFILREEKSYFDDYTQSLKSVILDAEWIRIQVTGEVPVIKGFTFVAKIEHTGAGNMISQPYGQESVVLDESLRTAKATCDHCKKSRSRLETFVLRNNESGQMIRIGRNCLRDFLGHENPEQLVDMIAEFSHMIKGESEDGCEGFYGRAVTSMSLMHFLPWVCGAIRTFGYVTSKMVYEGQGFESSAHVADRLMNMRDWKNADRKEYAAKPTAEDIELSTKICQWWNEVSLETRQSSDYFWNMNVACPVVEDLREDCYNMTYLVKKMALVASLVGAYKRDMEKAAKVKAVELNTGEFMGTPGDKKFSATGVLIEAREIASDYGCSTHVVIKTSEGNLVDWWAKNPGTLNVGSTITLTGTIKKHTAFKGEKLTTLTRAKVS